MGSTSYGVGFADWTSDKPEHWVFEGTNMKKGDRVAQLVGWEYHGPPLGKHSDLVVLSEGPVYGANGEKRTGTYATTLYTAPKGNLVFNAGTCWWNMVLSTPPGFPESAAQATSSATTSAHPADHEEHPGSDDRDEACSSDRWKTLQEIRSKSFLAPDLM